MEIEGLAATRSSACTSAVLAEVISCAAAGAAITAIKPNPAQAKLTIFLDTEPVSQ
jgi:hypothetical protein